MDSPQVPTHAYSPLSSMSSPEPPTETPGPDIPTWPTQPIYSNLGEPEGSWTGGRMGAPRERVECLFTIKELSD